MVKEIKNQELVSIPEVKEILDRVFDRMEKLGQVTPDPFQEATYEYVHNFAKMSASTAKKIIKMLVADYKMDKSIAIQVVNIDPVYPQELKVIFEKDPTLRELSDEDLTIMIQKIRDLEA